MSANETPTAGGRAGNTARVQSHLSAYLEEGDVFALAAAVNLCRASAIDVGAVLDWLGAQDTDAPLKARALLEVRRALGLPLRPGAVCSTPR